MFAPSEVRYQGAEIQYKQIRIGYQISNFFKIGQFNVLKCDVPCCLAFNSAPICFYRNGFELEACLKMTPLK